eukprot:Clim_evm95s225 gene=Clim_evmTU95s225
MTAASMNRDPGSDQELFTTDTTPSTVRGSGTKERRTAQRQIFSSADTLTTPSNAMSIPQPETPQLGKVIQDPVHGPIEVHPLICKFIDTPQFQRLRFIRQLGACYYVYPGASHNRFEHCIGTYHLATEWLNELALRQPELGLNAKDELMVGIAALCHDLGHGPYSHMFDNYFIPEVRPDRPLWKHEDASIKMLYHLIECNELWPQLELFGLNPQDVEIIADLICPSKELSKTDLKVPYEKAFLYDIVANKRSGIDCDKLDYFVRDAYMLGMRTALDHHRLFKFCRVITPKKVDAFSGYDYEDDEWMEKEHLPQICFDEKEASNLYELFHTRWLLHRRAYQHKVTCSVEMMHLDCLMAADPHVTFRGKGGKVLRISECIDDMVAFTKLNDHVFTMIALSNDPKLVEAQAILERIDHRDLYRWVTHVQPTEPKTKQEVRQIQDEIVSCARGLLNPGDVIARLVNMDYGMKDKDPVATKTFFYSKAAPYVAFPLRKDQVSGMLPDTFNEQYIFVYSRKKELIQTVKDSVRRWHKRGKCRTPRRPLYFNDVTYTPQRQPTASEASPAHSQRVLQRAISQSQDETPMQAAKRQAV